MPRHSSEHELTLSLLDFTVAVAEDGKTSFEFYKKPTKKPPVNRITYSIQHFSSATAQDTLRLNGYNENETRKSKQRVHHHDRHTTPPETNWLDLKISFISENRK